MFPSNTWRCLAVLPLLLLWSAASSCSSESAHSAPSVALPAPVDESSGVEVVSRTMAMRFYPCSRCHGQKDGSQAALTGHAEIHLKHMNGKERCESCHSEANPQRLRLASGDEISIEEAPELCRQCHSSVYADWTSGIHGKQVGGWQQGTQRFSCSACHDPHRPAIAPMQATPAPAFPTLGIPKGEH